MRRVAFIGIGLCLALGAAAQDTPYTLGSKLFTENVILAEMATQRLRAAGFAAEHREGLGGTQFLWQALLAGDLDAYPEYTGTLRYEIFAGDAVATDAALRTALAAEGLRMTPPLGFNNTYALGMRREHAEALGLRTISDLRQHPDLRFGFSNEFLDRGDGWPALRTAYGLPQTDVRGLDHDLAYRGLESGDLDVIDLYATDAEIAYYDLAVLQDDRQHFPTYHAVYLYRADLPAAAARLLDGFAQQLPESTMVAMNAQAKLERVPEAQVAAVFLAATFALDVAGAAVQTRTERIRQRTLEHLGLVGGSLLAAILLAIPLGVAAAAYPRLGVVILGIVGVLYTIPALALLVFMIPLLGIGGPPAMVALFLYSLLPIVRNTHAGLTSIDPALRVSAEALGLSAWAKLTRIELPLASRAVLAGIKTAAVINIGTATLGALIGAGGYGQPILTGIRLDDLGLILEGAVPAAVLALLAQYGFDLSERLFVPKGLRL